MVTKTGERTPAIMTMSAAVKDIYIAASLFVRRGKIVIKIIPLRMVFVKKPDEGGKKMKCPQCGSNRTKESDNFCGECGKKLKFVCDCWVKGGRYNCGKDNCPGYSLLFEKTGIGGEKEKR